MQNKNDGLPEIAQKSKNNKIVIGLVILVAVIAVGRMLFHASAHSKTQKISEEIYTPEVQPNAALDNKDISKPAKNEIQQNPETTKEMMRIQAELFHEKQKELEQRLSAPLLIVNKTSEQPSASSENATAKSDDPNTQFLNRLSGQETERVNASNIGSLNSVIAEGNFIHAILESATDSDLPGYLRAIVSEAVFSEDGSQVLIPPGSRLIGQYKSGMLQGQSRIYIVWTRVITPEGVSVNLGSPGVDSLGVAGLGADEIDRHFWERFGNASLLSLIGAGAATAGVDNTDQLNSAAIYRAAVASSFQQTAAQTLQMEGVIAPTLKTYQGKPIIVFVARDLHFEDTIKQTNSHVNIF